MTTNDRPRTGRTAATAALAAAAALWLLPGPALGQSAREVLETALDRYEERMERVENYTVVQSVLGTESTLYFERVDTEPGEPPRFRPVTTTDFDEAPADGAAALGAADPYALLDEMISRAELRGTELLDGRNAFVIAVDDLSGVDLGWNEGAEGSDPEFRPRSATLWFDVDRYVLLRSSFAGTMERDGRSSEVTAEARMSDYREVDGMLHPFRTAVTVEGLAGGLSEDEREQLRRAREEMERQLEGMSEEQRAMVERMMEKRMPRMAALAEGTMEITIEVRDLRVNEGPPEELRAAAKGRARMREAREREAATRAEEQRRPREAAARRSREPAPVDPSEHELRYPGYGGLYESTGEESISLFVTERCGSGDLVIGAMRGDVAPWVFEEVEEGEFRAPAIGPGGDGMRVRFETGPGGEPVFEILSERWEEYGRLHRSGELPQGWERCMQPRR